MAKTLNMHNVPRDLFRRINTKFGMLHSANPSKIRNILKFYFEIQYENWKLLFAEKVTPQNIVLFQYNAQIFIRAEHGILGKKICFVQAKWHIDNAMIPMRTKLKKAVCSMLA